MGYLKVHLYYLLSANIILYLRTNLNLKICDNRVHQMLIIEQHVTQNYRELNNRYLSNAKYFRSNDRSLKQDVIRRKELRLILGTLVRLLSIS